MHMQGEVTESSSAARAWPTECLVQPCMGVHARVCVHGGVCICGCVRARMRMGVCVCTRVCVYMWVCACVCCALGGKGRPAACWPSSASFPFACW